MGDGGTERGFSAAVGIFIVGIAAVAVTVVYSGLHETELPVLICEILVLASLIGLLVMSVKAKKRIEAEKQQLTRSPYGEVDKKEISKIFDIIDEEEKRRLRSSAFVATGSLSGFSRPVKKTEESNDEGIDAKSDTAPTTQPSESTAEEGEERLPIVFPDKEEHEANAARASEPKSAPQQTSGTASSAVTTATKTAKAASAAGAVGAAAAALAAASAEAAAPAQTPQTTQEKPQTEKPRGKEEKKMGDNPRPGNRPQGQRPQGGQGTPPVRYDQYGRPIPQRRQAPPAPQPPVQYDQYGRPIPQRRQAPPMAQPPVQYDQYGRPIPQRRQAPPMQPGAPVRYDQYGRPIPQRRQAPPMAQPPVQYDQYGRPIPQRRQAPPMQPGMQRQNRPPRPGQPKPQTAAPNAPAEESKPIVASAADALASVEAAAAQAAAAPAAAPAAVQRPANYYDEDYMPVIIPPEYAEEEEAAAALAASMPPRTPAGGAAGIAYAPEDERIPIILPPDEDDGYIPIASQPGAQYQQSYNQGYTPGGSVPSYQRPLGGEMYSAAAGAEYHPDNSEEYLPVIVPHFEDEADSTTYIPYTSPAGQAPVGGAPGGREEILIQVDPSISDPVEDEDHFVFVPHFEGDDPLPPPTPEEPPEPEKPKIPHYKIAKMRRRKMRRMSRRRTRFKVQKSLSDLIHSYSNMTKHAGK